VIKALIFCRKKVLMALHSANISGKLWHPLNQHFDFELVLINNFLSVIFLKNAKV